MNQVLDQLREGAEIAFCPGAHLVAMPSYPHAILRWQCVAGTGSIMGAVACIYGEDAAVLAGRRYVSSAIAASLAIDLESPRLEKMGLKTNAEVTAYALRNGLVA